MVYESTGDGDRKVNQLFKADFFGEKALLSDAPRCQSRTVCIVCPSGTVSQLRIAHLSLVIHFANECIFIECEHTPLV